MKIKRNPIEDYDVDIVDGGRFSSLVKKKFEPEMRAVANCKASGVFRFRLALSRAALSAISSVTGITERWGKFRNSAIYWAARAKFFSRYG